MRYLLTLLIIFNFLGCSNKYVILDEDKKIDCRKVGTIWWGRKGEQPTSKEVELLCNCFNWKIEKR